MGMMDMMGLMKNLPGMMERMQTMKEELRNRRFTGRAGGGMVEVVMNGTGELLDITLDPEVVDPGEIGMLQDLIVAASADARRAVAEGAQEEISKAAGGVDLSSLGIDLPGLG